MKTAQFIPGVFCFLLLLMCSPFSGFAQQQLLSYQSNDSIVLLKTALGVYHISTFSKQVVEVDFTPINAAYTPQSYAVVGKRNAIQTVTETSDFLEIASGELSVRVNKSPFELGFYGAGNLLLSQKAFNESVSKADSIELTFRISAEEVLYGGGARALGMNRRGNRLALYNKAHYGYEERSELMNYTLPIMLSSNNYLLHIDNPSNGFLDLARKDPKEIKFEGVSGPYRYHVIYHEDWDEILYEYTALTGRQPLPPLWSLGNFASRFGYHSEREVLDVVARFEAENIPLDAVILDLYWFGNTIKGTMGNLAFYQDSFPNPKAFLTTLRSKSIQPILITEPFVLTTSSRWEEALKEGVLSKDSSGNVHTYDFYFGNTGLIDVFDPGAKKWFWSIYKELRQLGVQGVWGDLGEPEVHPSEIVHFGDKPADHVHNVFGHEWARLVYEGYQRDFPKDRVFNLMRAGAAGSQRYGLIPWSGDVNRTWGGLKPQMEIALQMGMQGLAYMHSDLGGFAGDYDDTELYLRWLQYGVFQPIFRPHAQEEVASEPVFKDKETMKLAKQAIDLRYRLLPYNYALAYRNSFFGSPLMRPLFFDYPSDTTLLNVSETFLWGKSFLITPIVEKGVKQQAVTFPANSNWYDFYTEETLSNEQNQAIKKLVNTQRDHIPTFVKAGDIIPLHNPMMNTTEYDISKVVWHIYIADEVNSNATTIYFDNQINSRNDGFKFSAYTLSYVKKKRKLQVKLRVEGPNDFQISKDQIRVVGGKLKVKLKQ